ncbi:MAG: hypothetical protein AMJ43_07995 [Coxiella sp. DG_40]|nr:MAG: hypothetical protein AMJ43_07995 [Coxiella sp. DG_40]
MAAEDMAGTIVNTIPRHETGKQYTRIGYYALTEALELNDTITFSDMVPGGCRVDYVILQAPELDTDGTPTGTIDVGDSDQDKFIDGIAMDGGIFTINNVATGLVNTPYTSTTDIVITVPTAVATGATSGLIILAVTYTATGNE